MNSLKIQFGLVNDCLRACVFGSFLDEKKPHDNAWDTFCDMCYSDVLLSWNCIFGTRSQETHWRNFVSEIQIPRNEEFHPFKKQLILEHLNVTEKEWDEYHNSMVTARNERIAHINIGEKVLKLPNILFAMNSCQRYREWLIEYCVMLNKHDSSIRVSKTSSSDVCRLYLTEIEKIYYGL